MFKKILVPLDGSELAERALQPAMALAAANSAELILLRVPILKELLMIASDAYPIHWPDQMLERCRQEAVAYLDDVSQHQISTGVDQVRPLVVEGDPAAAIVDTAEVEGVDLIVMSTHGRSGLGHWIMGSITEKVLRVAPCPVLVIREARPLQRVLITLDGSALSERALEPGLALARSLGADVTLLHVQERVGDVDPRFVSELEEAEKGLGEQYRIDFYRRGEQYVENTAARVEEPGLKIQTRVAGGPAAQGILTLIEQEAIDLCVMATHGRSGLQRWVYGSVTEKVLRATKSAMMIVRPSNGDFR